MIKNLGQITLESHNLINIGRWVTITLNTTGAVLAEVYSPAVLRTLLAADGGDVFEVEEIVGRMFE